LILPMPTLKYGVLLQELELLSNVGGRYSAMIAVLPLDKSLICPVAAPSLRISFGDSGCAVQNTICAISMSLLHM
jgi:hypothetical protein